MFTPVIKILNAGRLKFMPYDLHGNYYKSAREAEMAEMNQVNEIDNRINNERIKRLERMNERPEIWQYVHMLEERISELEKKLLNP